ncbi:SRPBCC family protein [Brevibacillus reuszeri]|uniref:SRPBCC family protein n=1 Tax=Brevibacillus reuszeri TaxID=54915 RepID=UPI000CCC1178|nr:SRPBCC family protein [Brevibacillus reuszeri]
MLAGIQKTDEGFTARFDRHLKHSVESVWAYLTENEKLATWFSELSVDDLREGGSIKFDMQDGTFEEMMITALETCSVLEYTWGEDLVHFELYPEAEGCLLVLKEYITKLTSHTPRDLAGWHVCLDVIAALLDEREIPSRQEEWKKWYEQYVKAVETIA